MGYYSNRQPTSFLNSIYLFLQCILLQLGQKPPYIYSILPYIHNIIQLYFAATIYGKGSYFARDASYSSYIKYSPPDGNGQKHVYLARVLTGEYTQGDEGMKEPPNKDEHRKYDSVVNKTSDPSIFVVFFDTQAYPEYLIEFTA